MLEGYAYLDLAGGFLGVVVSRLGAFQRRITDDILQISRLRLGRYILEETDFWVDELIRSTVHMFESEAHATRIGLEYVPQMPRAHVHGDAQRIAQILVNVLANAIKVRVSAAHRRTKGLGGCGRLKKRTYANLCPSQAFVVGPSNSSALNYPAPRPLPHASTQFTRCVENRRVRVVATVMPGMRASQRTLFISVHDTGIGMTKTEQAKLFLPFAQANTKTFSIYGGSGMGLFITKELLGLMGGSVRVQSVADIGTTSTLEIPVHVAASDPDSSPRSAALSLLAAQPILSHAPQAPAHGPDCEAPAAPAHPSRQLKILGTRRAGMNEADASPPPPPSPPPPGSYASGVMYMAWAVSTGQRMQQSWTTTTSTGWCSSATSTPSRNTRSTSWSPATARRRWRLRATKPWTSSLWTWRCR